MVSYIDDLFGRVREALDNTAFSDTTIICFTSDHGDMLGERGMWFKKTLFEPAVRIPLMIHLPGRSGVRVKSAASLVDLLPTLLDFAGTPIDVETTPIDGLLVVAGHRWREPIPAGLL